MRVGQSVAQCVVHDNKDVELHVEERSRDLSLSILPNAGNNIRHMTLHFTHIRTIPPMNNLIQLNVHGSSIHTMMSQPQLRFLDLRNSSVFSLSHQQLLSELVLVNAQDIYTLPKLPNLKRLMIIDCKHIMSLPSAMYRLKSLQIRGVTSYRKITSAMPRLNHLDIPSHLTHSSKIKNGAPSPTVFDGMYPK